MCGCNSLHMPYGVLGAGPLGEGVAPEQVRGWFLTRHGPRRGEGFPLQTKGLLYYHCVWEGAGLRHYTDYFMLLVLSSAVAREFVWGKFQRFCLGHACAAIMWVLQEVFGLARESMLCPPDRRRGMRLYREMFAGGNFGRGKSACAGDASVCVGDAGGKTLRDPGCKTRREGVPKKRRPFARWLGNRVNALGWLAFDPLNTVLREVQYWRATISLIPERIRRRKVFL